MEQLQLATAVEERGEDGRERDGPPRPDVGLRSRQAYQRQGRHHPPLLRRPRQILTPGAARRIRDQSTHAQEIAWNRLVVQEKLRNLHGARESETFKECVVSHLRGFIWISGTFVGRVAYDYTILLLLHEDKQTHIIIQTENNLVP